ncbi:MAG: tetratricopeptide repeat protein [Planctomycetes bacterium]|nr:tetratricopeptide repeat protein [Planctomycetota bacterium]
MIPTALVLAATLALQVVARGDGFDYLKQGKPAFARTAFRNQLKRDPSDPRALGGLGLAELALGNDQAACTTLLEALAAGQKGPEVRLGLGRACLRLARARLAVGLGDDDSLRYLLADAEDQARQSAALAPADPQPWVVVVEACLEQGAFGRAEEAAAEAERRGLDAKAVKALRGQLAYYAVREQVAAGSETDYVAAKDALLALIRDDPGSAELRLRLGDLHHAFGQWQEALTAWKGAFVLEPFDRPALDLVLAYLKVPALADAARATLEAAADAAQKRVTGNDPRPAYALFCVGQARLFARELDAATTLFRKARNLDDTLVLQCSLGLAEAAFKTQQFEEAATEWKRAFAADHAGAVALLHHLGTATTVSGGLQYLASVAVKKQQAGEARELLAAAFGLQPDDPVVCNDYAFLCRETGKHAESWEAYARLIELQPENPRYLNDAALILQDYLKKDLALARSLYERAIECADRLLGDPLVPQASKELAASARTDASNNLRRLPPR